MSEVNTPKKEEKKSNKLFLPIVIIMALSLVGNVVLLLTNNSVKTELNEEILVLNTKNEEINTLYTESAELVNLLKIDTTNLSNDLKAKYAEIQRLQQENDEIMATITDKTELNKRLQANLNRMKRLNKELDAEVKKLKSENVVLTTKNTKLEVKVDSLKEKTIILTEKISKAERLMVEYLEAKPLKGVFLSDNYKETDKAKRTQKIDVSFSVIKNELAKIGERTAYVRIINGENQILGKPEYKSGNFVTDDGDTLKFSLKADFNYRGEKEDVSLEYQDLENTFAPGKYKVEVYITGYKATTTTFTLK
jgi:uncharacterized membrane-anchored protein YhcB (DUF1043 family)